MKKYSLAYGRNLDIKRMKERCPHCKLVGKGMLKDWQLAFKKYITIEKKLGKEVPVGIWEIDEIAEKELDIIEGFPTMYRKEYVEIEINGKLEQALVYIINDTHSKYPDKPYFERILIGYNDFKFDRKYLYEAVARIPKKKVSLIPLPNKGKALCKTKFGAEDKNTKQRPIREIITIIKLDFIMVLFPNILAIAGATRKRKTRKNIEKFE